ncbi:MAG TPA: hypothetical protein DIS94_11330 [Bacteroidetes bacterium]|nr:hypothetical protein [Bacteroidota bacterium]
MVYKIINIFIALVWIVNGLFFKILNIVPRHKEIVNKIFPGDWSDLIILIIGILEVLLAIWILTGFKIRLNTLLQVLLILTMNIIEFFYVPDLLLFGKFNLFFAIIFCILILLNEFKLKKENV